MIEFISSYYHDVAIGQKTLRIKKDNRERNQKEKRKSKIKGTPQLRSIPADG
jgi:hypothetical protein